MRQWLAVLAVIVIIAGVYEILSPRQPKAYKAGTICNDAFEKQYDLRSESKTNFTIEMREGCFGGFIYPPEFWKNWHVQPSGDNQRDWWIAYWFTNEYAALGPYRPNSVYTFHAGTQTPFRIQGKGKVKLFTNVTPSGQFQSSTPSSRAQLSTPPPVGETPPPLKTISHVYANAVESHFCDKPKDVYYGIMGLNFSPNGLAGVGYSPHFLFDANHNDEIINWGNGFKGKVPVCFIVDTSGNPTEIVFPQPPDQNIQDHIKERINAWRYIAGYIDLGTYSNPRHENVPMMLAYTFTFQ